MAYKIILWIDAGVGRLLPPQLKSYYDDLPFTIPGLGVIVLIVSMILIGMFAAGFVGSFFVRLGDWMVKKMPVISSVYSLLKQVFETFLSNKSQAFSRVALLEYPRKGIWFWDLSAPIPAAKSGAFSTGRWLTSLSPPLPTRLPAF